MSASLSAMPGGQPSITQPMAGPWDSPKLVTAKRCPKVLPLMGGDYPPQSGAGRRGARMPEGNARAAYSVAPSSRRASAPS